MRKLSLTSDHYEKIVNGFISYYSSEVSNRRSQLGFNYNVLAEQCGNIVENSHTNLLMRLLQYRNKYGYVFLEDFISLAGFNIAIENRDVLYETEYSVGSNTGKKGRIDGIIYQNSNFAIIIENKINHAGNQEEQVDGTFPDSNGGFLHERKRTSDGEIPSESSFHLLLYNHQR